MTNRVEQDGRKVNWNLKVNKDNINIFTWIKRKGTSHIENQEHDDYHYNMAQSTEPGYTNLQICKECLTNSTTDLQDNSVQIPETCKLKKDKKAKIFIYDMLNQRELWRRRTSCEISAECRFIEEETKNQLSHLMNSDHNIETEKFLEVEIRDIGLEVIENNIEISDYREILIEEYHLNCRE